MWDLSYTPGRRDQQLTKDTGSGVNKSVPDFRSCDFACDIVVRMSGSQSREPVSKKTFNPCVAVSKHLQFHSQYIATVHSVA